MKYGYTTVFLGALATKISAHTWVEQLNVIASNGTMVGAAGFPRGNVKRGEPGFGDPAMVNLLPPNGAAINGITAQDLMCKNTQTTQTQTNGSPRLQAGAGANVALRYQENGHVSLPQGQPGKPDNRGTIYVYGTTQPEADDKFLDIHRIWTPDGKGGDGRGVLLATRDYDDGQCHQVNGGEISQTRQKAFPHATNQLMGSDMWCQTDIQLPASAESGKPYTLYWVWDWPTLPGTPGFPDGKQEIYTTCMDIDIASDASGTNTQNKAAAVQFIKGQDLGNAGVAAQLADIANPTAVTGQLIPFSAQAAATGASSRAPAAGSTVIASTTAPVVATTQAASSAAPSQPAQPSQNNNGNPGGNGGRRTRTRPSVNPVGQTSAPFPQASAQSQAASAETQSSAAPANTGTAIARPDTAAATTTGARVISSGAANAVVQVQTMVSTIVETKMQTVYQSKRSEPTPAPAATLESQTSSERCSRTQAAYRLRARSPFYIVPGNKETGC